MSGKVCIVRGCDRNTPYTDWDKCDEHLLMKPIDSASCTGSCRRCTECEGEEHHWLGVVFADNGDFMCKHCDATSEPVTCEGCDDEIPQAIAKYDIEDGVYLCPECSADE